MIENSLTMAHSQLRILAPQLISILALGYDSCDLAVFASFTIPPSPLLTVSHPTTEPGTGEMEGEASGGLSYPDRLALDFLSQNEPTFVRLVGLREKFILN
jgi:hypothetical protein